MGHELKFDLSKTAVLIMDYQKRQIFGQPEDKRKILLGNAKRILSASRGQGLPVIYVEVRSRQGPPEFKPWEKERRQMSGKKKLGEREEIYEIHPEVLPQKDEIVVTKRRIGPFSTTDLSNVLENLRIENLVLMGISTGGVVLSVVRWAADIDYQLIVLSDACADPDEEVHRVLVEKVFPRQTTVMTCDEFLKSLKSEPFAK